MVRKSLGRSPLALALVVVGLTLAGLVASSVGCGGTGASPDKVTLQLNWFHEAEFVGYYVAGAKGLYDRQSLKVDIIEGGPGSPSPQ